jgi:hypothetical protein
MSVNLSAPQDYNVLLASSPPLQEAHAPTAPATNEWCPGKRRDSPQSMLPTPGRPLGEGLPGLISSANEG